MLLAAWGLTAGALVATGRAGFGACFFEAGPARFVAGRATARARVAEAFWTGAFLASLRTVLLKMGASGRGTKKSGNIPQVAGPTGGYFGAGGRVD